MSHKMNLPQLYKLKSGFTIAFIPVNGIDSVTIHLRGRAGSINENNDHIGCAHITEHLSINIPDKKEILDLGGKIYGVTSRADVLFMVKILGKDIETGIKYLSNVFSVNNFTDKSVEIQKKLSIEEIKRVMNIPEKLIGRISYRLLFPNHRMGKLNTGDIQDIRKIKTENIIEFKKQNYRPENFVLVFSGNVNRNSALKFVKRYFNETEILKKINGKKYTEQNNASKAAYPQQLTFHNDFVFQIEIIQGLTQDHIKVDYFGFKISDDESYYSKVLASLTDNYLKNILKEKYGAGYMVKCESFNSSEFGIFSIYVAANPKYSEEIIEIIKNIRNDLSRYIKKTNIEIYKKQVLFDFIFGLEKVSYIADFYSEVLLHGKKYQNHKYQMKKILETKTEDLIKVKDYIFNQHPKITILTDRQSSYKLEQF